MQDIFHNFPLLEERADTPGGVLSGGELKILAMCRALMGNPDLIMIDEPTEGVSPMMVERAGRLFEETVKRVSLFCWLSKSSQSL